MDRTSGANPWDDDGSSAAVARTPVGCGGEKIGCGPIGRGITAPTISRGQWAIVDWWVSRHGGFTTDTRVRGATGGERSVSLHLPSLSLSLPLLVEYHAHEEDNEVARRGCVCRADYRASVAFLISPPSVDGQTGCIRFIDISPRTIAVRGGKKKFDCM